MDAVKMKNLSDKALADAYRSYRTEALEIFTELTNRGYSCTFNGRFVKIEVGSYVFKKVTEEII